MEAEGAAARRSLRPSREYRPDPRGQVVCDLSLPVERETPKSRSRSILGEEER